MLIIRNISKVYNGIKVVNNLNFSIKEGEIYTMLGANGAGKTTTINMIFNFIEPTEGDIIINNIEVRSNPSQTRKMLGYVSENVMLYEDLDALQNLMYFTKLSGIDHYSKQDYFNFLIQSGLQKDAITRKLRTFSKGMRQKCGIAIAIAKDAKIIILDEPTSGLDPKSGKEFISVLNDLKNQGKTIFMTTHDIFRAKEISDTIGIMVQGNLVKEMTKEEFKSLDLEDTYLKFIEI